MSDSILIFLISQGFVLSTAFVGIYVKVTTKLRELEIRVKAVEKQDDIIINKLNNIDEDIGEIKVELQNKQNRE